MPDTKSKGDFLMFRETLTELERLLDVQVKGYLFSEFAGAAMEDGISFLLKLLTKLDVNTSESNAIDDLERLAELRSRRISPTGRVCLTDLSSTSLLDKMIDSKIDFIKKGSFSLVDSEDGVDPIVTLERLAAVKTKTHSRYMDGLLESKIREIRSVQPDTASGHEVATASGQISETQENSETKHWADSKSRANSISSLFKGFRDQDSIRADDDNDSTVDGGELTPTSTIVSEFPDPNGG